MNSFYIFMWLWTGAMVLTAIHCAIAEPPSGGGAVFTLFTVAASWLPVVIIEFGFWIWECAI